MTERQPTPGTPSWELAPIRDALNAEWELQSDPALGDRILLRLPYPAPVEIACFPSTGLVHLSTPDNHLVLARLHPPVLDERGVVFSSHSEHLETELVVTHGGAVTLQLTPVSVDSPAAPPERPQDASDDANSPITRDTQATPADGDPAAPEDGSDNRLEQGMTNRGSIPAFQAHRSTRVGAPFSYHQQDLLIGRFPLAVHHEDASTTWHPIVVFGERAAALQGDEFKRANWSRWSATNMNGLGPTRRVTKRQRSRSMRR